MPKDEIEIGSGVTLVVDIETFKREFGPCNKITWTVYADMKLDEAQEDEPRQDRNWNWIG